MSYDINNYAFRGVPLNTFIENLKKRDVETSFQLASDDNERLFLEIDGSLISLLEESNQALDSLVDSRRKINCPEIAFEIARDDHAGAKDTLLLSLLKACGINYEDSYQLIYQPDGTCNEIVNRFPYDLFEKIKSYFLVQKDGVLLSKGLIEIPKSLSWLAQIASSKTSLTFYLDPKYDNVECDLLDPVYSVDLIDGIEEIMNFKLPFVKEIEDCLGVITNSKSTKPDELTAKKARLEFLVNNEVDFIPSDLLYYLQERNYQEASIRTYDNDRMWREAAIEKLIEEYITPSSKWIEEEDIWSNDCCVVSTHFGDVHNHGGMKENEMYLVLGDTQIQDYDERGWSDPQSENPIAFKATLESLFGDPDFPTEVYTPQIGG